MKSPKDVSEIEAAMVLSALTADDGFPCPYCGEEKQWILYPDEATLVRHIKGEHDSLPGLAHLLVSWDFSWQTKEEKR